MLQRHVTAPLEAALGDTPVVLLDGARQTGKTTLVRAVARGTPRRQYLTLDDATVLAARKFGSGGVPRGSRDARGAR